MLAVARRQPAADLHGRLHPQRDPPAAPDDRGRGRGAAVGGYRERTRPRLVRRARGSRRQGLTVDGRESTRSQREHLEVPAGRIETAGARDERARRGRGASTSRRFRKLVVAYRDGAPVRLSDVAVVEDGLEDRRRDGAAPTGSRRSASASRSCAARNAVAGRAATCKAQDAEIAQATCPRGSILVVNFDTHDLRRAARSTRSCSRWCWPSLLTGLVCWLFLGSWSHHRQRAARDPDLDPRHVHRDVLLRLHAEHRSRVLGLTLVVGIVVDDAIMVLENIYRHREEGERQGQGRLGRRARDHLRGRRRHRRDRRHLPARGLHEGHHRQVLLPVRRDDLGGGAALAARGAHARPDALLALPRGGRARHALGQRRGPRVRPARGRATCACWSRRSHHRGCGAARWPRSSSSRSLGFTCPLPAQASSCPRQDMSRFLVRFQTPVGTSLDATDRVFRRSRPSCASRPEVRKYFGVGRRLRRRRGQHRHHVRRRMKDPCDRPRDPQRPGRRLTHAGAHGRGAPGGKHHPRRARRACRTSRRAASSRAAAAASRWSSTIRGRDWDDAWPRLARRSWRRCASRGS